MTDIIWPVDLPQMVSQDNYQEARGRNTIRTPVDQGRPKARRRFTSSIQTFTVTVYLTADQADIFDDFWENTTAAGSLEFDWVHPRTQEAAVCQFTGDDPPPMTPDGAEFKATFQMIILP
jgi:hypothetical protein